MEPRKNQPPGTALAAEPVKPMVALLLAAGVGSVMGLFARELARELTVIEQVCLRCLLGAALLFVFCPRLIDRKRIACTPRGDLL